MALNVTLRVETVKIMKCVTKRVVTVLMNARVTGRGTSVMVGLT